MIPLRFRNLRPYLATFVFSRFPRPPLSEIIRWTFQPGKQQRAAKYIQSVLDKSDMKEIWFNNYNKPFYYPKKARWIDLCQTVDECLNPKNWHHFITNQTQLKETDIVVDCGAAEGLFSFVSAFTATMVYSIEPIPSWHA